MDRRTPRIREKKRGEKRLNPGGRRISILSIHLWLFLYFFNARALYYILSVHAIPTCKRKSILHYEPTPGSGGNMPCKINHCA